MSDNMKIMMAFTEYLKAIGESEGLTLAGYEIMTDLNYFKDGIRDNPYISEETKKEIYRNIFRIENAIRKEFKYENGTLRN